jgi:hypothetical protein
VVSTTQSAAVAVRRRVSALTDGRSLSVALIAMTLVACQPQAVRPQAAGNSAEVAADLTPLSASAGVGGDNVRTDKASASIVLPAYVPVRRYTDVFTLDGVNRKVFVEYGWDYARGLVVETVYEANGKIVSRTDKPGHTLSFSDRELELAIALAREDARLRDVLAAEDLNFYAGFPYREPDRPDCSAQSRCVHVIVSAGDGQRHVAHAIVDLMTRRVVNPSLDPDRKPDPVPDKH